MPAKWSRRARRGVRGVLVRVRRPVAAGLAAAGLLIGTVLAFGVAPGLVSASTATGGPQPAVPASGAYLGVWLNPNLVSTTTANLLRSLQLLPQFDASMGRPAGFVHLFQPGNLNKHAPVTIGTLRAVAATGAIPMIDWPCAVPDTQITGGNMDTAIKQFAEELATYGGPVFVRWSWEMNLTKLPGNEACQGSSGAKGWVAAYKHIEGLIAPIASNVAFVWCPSVAGTAATPSTFFPGTAYVTWIGMDGYERTVSPTSAIAHWQSFYSKFSGDGKPIVVAETGAPNGASGAESQAQFLAAVLKALPSMPEIKAVGYYDSETDNANWTLNTAGLAEFRALGESPYLSFITPQGGGTGT